MDYTTNTGYASVFSFTNSQLPVANSVWLTVVSKKGTIVRHESINYWAERFHTVTDLNHGDSVYFNVFMVYRRE